MWWRNHDRRSNHVDTVHECDRRTDRQTDRITITKTVQRRASHGKNPWLFQDPMINFSGPFRSPWMLKYKEKRSSKGQERKWGSWGGGSEPPPENLKFGATWDIIIHHRNALMCNFQGYFSRTFQDQSDFPGLSSPGILTKKSKTFQDFPGEVGTLHFSRYRQHVYVLNIHGCIDSWINSTNHYASCCTMPSGSIITLLTVSEHFNKYLTVQLITLNMV